jgi:hypothetical protein
MTPPPGYDGPKPVRSGRRNRVHVSEDYRATLCGRACDGWTVADAVPTCQRCLIALAART